MTISCLTDDIFRSVHIAAADAALDFDPTTCTASNRQPIRFEVTGGTGDLAGASGKGHYDIAFTLPTCRGPQQAVHVWFSGNLDPGGAGR